MSAPDPASMTVLGQVIVAGVAIGGPIVGALLWLENRFAKKHTVNNQVQKVENEQGLHREYFAKVFDKMEQHAQRDEQTHREMLKQMSDNHAELLRELGRKADR